MTLLARPHVFERGDKLFLTTPVTKASPTEGQIEEFAFASAVKSSATNEHIGWLNGRYVEANKPNLNKAMWLSNELALKSLTPMLMPVTVMHDPRTAVGTIADCKLIGGSTEENATSASARIDTILAIWKHRFPDIWEEAEHNIGDGTMMQSMECLSPSYVCSDCGQQYIKLREGKEQASWCEHLRSDSSQRILQDVTFTGTGLIFGTRGGKGAYTEAYLSHFQDEIAEYHAKAHIDSTYRSSEGSRSQMPTVQIEETELAALRQERNDERKAAEDRAVEVRDLTTKVEKAEGEVAAEKTRADQAEEKAKGLEEKAQRATLKDKRMGELGQGFLGKLGEFTRERLHELASTLSDEEWEVALKEREETAKVKRDTKAEGESGSGEGEGESAGSKEKDGESAFESEEVAQFTSKGITGTSTGKAGTGTGARALARSLSRARKPVTTESKK